MCFKLGSINLILSYQGPNGKPNSVFDEDKVNRLTASNVFRASDLFNGVIPIYTKGMVHRSWLDNRCLVPYSHEDPTKWKNYEMHSYREAFNEKQLNKVDQFKYDNNLFNWVDPKVLKYFTKNRKSSRKAWKKTYGFPYVRAISWDNTDTTPFGGISPVNATKCFKKCAHLVSSYCKRYKV